MTVEEVDACTGPAVGWPKSATFRTADIVGLDVLMHVVKNIYETAPDDESRERYKVPRCVEEMVKRRWLGDKTGQGFYKKVSGEGEKEILTLDVNTMEYRPRQKAKFASHRKGQKQSKTRASVCALSSGLCWKARPAIRPSNLCGARFPKRAFMPRAAFRKFPTAWRTWTAPCAGASAGNSVPSKWWTRWASGAFAAQVQKEGRAMPAVDRKGLGERPRSFLPVGKR